ncbi:MAG: response regulator transcription factor [Lapillicoccus sp.]
MSDPSGAEVLVVEDDETIGRHVVQALENHRYRATWCRTGGRALEHLRSAPCEVMLLDLGLPDVDGVDVARRARAEHPHLLIIALTARTDEIDVISGLEAGADDYLTKPFTIAVLLARLRAHLRRQVTPAGRQDAVIVLGDLVIEPSSRRCLVRERDVSLRPKEYDLLATLAQQPGTALSRGDLMARIWDENWHGSTKTLDVTVANLRTSLAAAAPGVDVRMPSITTLRGYGYRLDRPPDHDSLTAGPEQG